MIYDPKIKAMAEKRLSKEPTFENKHKAVDTAVLEYQEAASWISVWSNPKGGYTVIHMENREFAWNLGYREVVNIHEICDMAKE